MKRSVLLVTLMAMISARCTTTLGRTIPECDQGSATMVLAVQSVPTSDYVACILGLKAGWEYEDLQARSGSSFFTLDSDRMGMGFVRVDNVESCDVGAASLVATDERGIELWKDVEVRSDVAIAVVPEGSATATSARSVPIILQLRDQEIKGRPVVAIPLVSSESTSSRIEAAVASGAHVIVISVRDAEEGTLTVLVRGSTTEVQVDSLADALELIEDVETEPSYTGNWYYRFDRGCVVYTFDAAGSGVTTIEDDIETALSLFDAEAFRQVARDAGYRLP